MSNSYYAKAKRKPKTDDDPFESLNSFIPKSTAAVLRRLADDRQMPISRLIAYAIDNELDSAEPFHYSDKIPDTPYVEFAYATEAGKLLRFLTMLKAGASKDTLLLCRREYGVESRDDVLCAYRELLEQGLIEEFQPKSRIYRSRDYIRARVVEKDVPREGARYKKLEGSSERITDNDVERDES